MLRIRKNPDNEKYKEVTQVVEDNDGYCPCLVDKNEDTKCMCKEFREQKTPGKCRCGRFEKVESDIFINGFKIEKAISEELNIYSESQRKISEILDGMKGLLLYKNQKYGDSALHPNNVFFKGDSTNSILIRLDDKIGRIKNNPEEKPRVNDVADIIGYCTLLLVSMGVIEEDLEKLKD